LRDELEKAQQQIARQAAPFRREERKKIPPDKMITEKDKSLAQKCLTCSVCSYARKKQKGLVFWLVKNIKGWLCPYCKAYQKVYARKAHEPIRC